MSKAKVVFEVEPLKLVSVTHVEYCGHWLHYENTFNDGIVVHTFENLNDMSNNRFLIPYVEDPIDGNDYKEHIDIITKLIALSWASMTLTEEDIRKIPEFETILKHL